MNREVTSAWRRVVAMVGAGMLGAGLLGWSAPARQDAPIDFDKARQLRQRELKGERLGDDDRAYLERAKAAFQAKQAAARKGTPAAGKPSIGLKPLTDLAGEATYKGQDGGLYGGGRNAPPEALLRAALEASREVRPLDAEGRAAPGGKIGLIAVGMSNTTQEFGAFLGLAGRDADRSPSVALVDGAQGGMEASTWADPEKVKRAGRTDPWTVLDRRIEQAGLTAKQVQVAWIKQARANPAALGEFPGHAQALRDDLAVIVGKLKARFPGLRLVYLSSRIYAGYAGTPLNPEPYAYESAFAVRWLIQDQIEGRPAPSPGPDPATARTPVLLWGPYLWADGVDGRKTDGLTWERGDLAADGTHPGPSGQQKVAESLLKFFKTDPTARGWFLRPPGKTP